MTDPTQTGFIDLPPTIMAPVPTTGFTPTTGPIPVGQTAPQTPLNLAGTINTPNGNAADGAVAGATQAAKTLPDYITSLTPPTTAADQQNQAILDSISGLTGELGNKGAEQATSEANAGIPGLQTTLQNLNNELNLKTADYTKQFTKLGGGAGGLETSAVMNAQQSGLKMSQAADIGIITARISAAQGNLQLAQNQVNRAIDLKYSTIEAKIATQRAQLDALAPTLNKEEKVRVLAQQQMLKDKEQAVADEKQKVKDNLNLALQAQVKTPFVNSDGRFFDARSGVTYGNEADFFKAAGVRTFEEAYQKGLVTDVNGSTLADQNLAAQAQAKYTDVSIPANASRDQIAEIIKGSRIYKKDTYIAPNAYSGGGLGGGGNGSTIDLGKYTDANAPQAELGGLSANGLMQSAKLFLANAGKMPSLGLGSGKATQAKRDAIINYAGQLADSMGLDINQISALYKANSKAAGSIIDRVAKIDTTSATLVSQFPRLAELADKVGSLGIKESDIAAGKAAAARKFGSTDAANYIELIQTVRGDYAALQSSLAGSKGGQFFGENARDAIPLGLTAEQYQGLANTIQMSAINAKNATSNEANNIISNYTSTGSDTSTVQLQDPKTGETRSFQGLSPQDIQDALNKGFKKVQ